MYTRIDAILFYAFFRIWPALGPVAVLMKLEHLKLGQDKLHTN